MYNVPPGSPLDEQGGRLRGLMDLAVGHYPKFLFGFDVGRLLPVFHFHQVTEATLDPAFRYLHENGYRTVACAEMARLVREGVHPGPRTVLLAFDDAWASLWMVVGPLLERYDLRAVTYAIPGRICDAAAVRPTIADGPVDAAAADVEDNPFVTWPELRALAASGRVDVQSHTWSHAMVFSGATPIGVVDAGYRREAPIIHPRLTRGRDLAFLSPDRVGHPMFARRSRMSDGRRFWPDADACARVEDAVRAAGGDERVEEPGWRERVGLAGAMPGRWETDAERAEEIEQELVLARDELQQRLGIVVEHLCLPWGITGSVTTRALERIGVRTAFANRLAGRMAVAAGDHPLYLKRLDNRHIFALPGTNRRVFTTLV